MYLNAPVETASEELVNFFDKSKHLSRIIYEGYTTYPPLAALGGPEIMPDVHFRFESHPFVPFRFRTGKMTVVVRKVKDKITYGPTDIKFMFDTKEESEGAYQYLVSLYQNVSTRKRFHRSADSQTAEFTDDNSKSIKEVMFTAGTGSVVDGPYVLIFGIGNDLDIESTIR